MCRIRCVNKYLCDYYSEHIKRIVRNRIFFSHLHLQTRLGCIGALSKLATSDSSQIKYTLDEGRVIFRCIFEEEADVNLKECAIEMLLTLCNKYTYVLLITEFIRSPEKPEFFRLCRCRSIENINGRDATKCRIVRKMLFQGDSLIRALALFILRSFVSKWRECIKRIVDSFRYNNDLIVRQQAELCISSRRKYEQAIVSEANGGGTSSDCNCSSSSSVAGIAFRSSS